MSRFKKALVLLLLALFVPQTLDAARHFVLLLIQQAQPRDQQQSVLAGRLGRSRRQSQRRRSRRGASSGFSERPHPRARSFPRS